MASSNKTLNNFFSSNKFIGSFKSHIEIPSSQINKECCFIGRSNVGKSSLINSITKTKKLAKTSKTPGRTQSINVFQISEKINVVDLPGYGFAKISKVMREKLRVLIEDYISHRTILDHIFILIDSKVGLKNSDIDMLDHINCCSRKFSIILTKIDRISDNQTSFQKNSILSLMKNYKNNFNNIYTSETKKNNGITIIQKTIYEITQKNEI